MSKIDSFVVGSKINDTLVLDSAEIRETKTNPPREYLNATFVAGKKSINAKMWDIPPRYVVPAVKMKYRIRATVGEYLGKKQLTLADIDLCEDQCMIEFMPQVNETKEQLQYQVSVVLQLIQDEKLKHIVETVYDRYATEIYNATSAKAIHHVGIGGNVQHSLEVTRTARAIISVNPQWTINKDLVTAGAMLHDIGKAFVYDMTTPVMDYTPIGHLMEHITYGITLLERLLLELGDEYEYNIRLLQHIIASHHGKLEYGSPVTPVFMEAYLVNYADQISATLDAINEANNEPVSETMTNKIWVGGNRQHFLQSVIDTTVTGGQDS